MQSIPERILRKHVVLEIRGRSNVSHYHDIKAGLFTPAVRIGANAVGWPESEVAALNAARIAGQNDEQIRALVKALVEARAAGVKAAA